MRTCFQKLLSFIINDLSSKAPRSTDFLRTHFQTPSKSPWLLVLLAYPLTLTSPLTTIVVNNNPLSLAVLFPSEKLLVYVVVNSLPPFYVHCPECYSVISLVAGVCCCSRMSCWFSSYLAALERSLNTYVYVVVNSFPAVLCPLSRMLFGHLPSRWGVLFPSD